MKKYFESTNNDSIFAFAKVSNKRSIKAPQKMGFRVVDKSPEDTDCCPGKEFLKIVLRSAVGGGVNENTNGLIRQYLPTKIDLINIPNFFLETIVIDLNTRPRKTLDFASPIKAFNKIKP